MFVSITNDANQEVILNIDKIEEILFTDKQTAMVHFNGHHETVSSEVARKLAVIMKAQRLEDLHNIILKEELKRLEGIG